MHCTPCYCIRDRENPSISYCVHRPPQQPHLGSLFFWPQATNCQLPYRIFRKTNCFFTMGLRGFRLQSWARAPRVRSVYRNPVLSSNPATALLRSSNSSLKSIQYPQSRPLQLANMSSTSTPTSGSSVEQQHPLPRNSQLHSSLGKCYVIDEVLSKRTADGRLSCVYRAR